MKTITKLYEAESKSARKPLTLANVKAGKVSEVKNKITKDMEVTLIDGLNNTGMDDDYNEFKGKLVGKTIEQANEIIGYPGKEYKYQNLLDLVDILYRTSIYYRSH